MFVDDLILQEDYREFAENYLGVDYEDYVQLLYEVERSFKDKETEYQLTYR
jgi:hypothetical protein